MDQVQVLTDACDDKTSAKGFTAPRRLRRERTSGTSAHAAITKDSSARDQGLAVAIASSATALLWNGLRRYEEAFGRRRRRSKPRTTSGMRGGRRSELVEAASRIGNTEETKPALEKLLDSARTRAEHAGSRRRARCQALPLR